MWQLCFIFTPNQYKNKRDVRRGYNFFGRLRGYGHNLYLALMVQISEFDSANLELTAGRKAFRKALVNQGGVEDVKDSAGRK